MRFSSSVRRVYGVNPASPHGVVIDDGEGAQHSRSYQSRPPDRGPEQGATEWFADRVGEHQTVLPQWVGLAMLLDDLDQPRWEGDRAPSGGALGERLDAGLPAHSDDGADHPESALIQIERVGAEAGCLSPSESGTTCGGDDGTVPIGHDREQDSYQLLARDDPFVGVVLASW
jgi:hypothetical protein